MVDFEPDLERLFDLADEGDDDEGIESEGDERKVAVDALGRLFRADGDPLDEPRLETIEKAAASPRRRVLWWREKNVLLPIGHRVQVPRQELFLDKRPL